MHKIAEIIFRVNWAILMCMVLGIKYFLSPKHLLFVIIEMYIHHIIAVSYWAFYISAVSTTNLNNSGNNTNQILSLAFWILNMVIEEKY